jgi:hypothetical protein
MKSKRKQPPKSNLILDLRGVTPVPKNSPKTVNSRQKYYRKKIAIGILAVVIGATVITVLTLHPSHSSKVLKEAKASVGRLMLLPTNEEPTIATVDDKTKLKDKFLAAHANNGDEVLIYTQNQLAIIYRPSIDKIAAVGTVTADSALAESQGVTMTVLDGANDPAKTQKIITQISTAYPSIKVTDGGQTNRQDFPTTIVIDNTKNKDYLIDELDGLIGGKRGVVPLGETQSVTDVMIIVGKDK